MPIIKRLPQELAGHIAAGEVIERPASVLKELLENSLDAGARRIAVDLLQAGRELLRVCDDGIGLEPADCRLAFERHATSKIAALEDLDRLATFGFRGEALASIASVSRTTLTSCPRGAKTGWRVELEGGRLRVEREAPPVSGTTVEVRDIFYNTPARLKFLKSDATEKSRLLRTLEEAALAHPSVGFVCRSDEKPLLSISPRESSDPEGDLRRRAQEVLGRDAASGLLYVRRKRDGLTFQGLLSPADRLAATRELQFLFVNRRPVLSRLLQQALYRAYEPFRTSGRHPLAVLQLELPPQELDVNVHPAKLEVRFRSERELFDLLAKTMSAALLQSRGIPTLTRAAPVASFSPTAYPSPAPSASQVSEPPPPPEPWFPSSVRYLGSIESSYLVFDDAGGLVVMDQHAAQERVLFERYLGELNSGTPTAQKLMLPMTLELPASAAAAVLARAQELKRWGFELEPFGKASIQITGVPALFGEAEARQALQRLLDSLLSPAAAVQDARYHATAAIACKAAVKAHDPLDVREALRLLEELRACRDGSRCPHGRPTLLALDREELARRFKRPGAPPQKP